MKKLRGPVNRGKGKVHLLSHFLYCSHCGIMYSGWIQNHKRDTTMFITVIDVETIRSITSLNQDF